MIYLQNIMFLIILLSIVGITFIFIIKKGIKNKTDLIFQTNERYLIDNRHSYSTILNNYNKYNLEQKILTLQDEIKSKKQQINLGKNSLKPIIVNFKKIKNPTLKVNMDLESFLRDLKKEYIQTLKERHIIAHKHLTDLCNKYPNFVEEFNQQKQNQLQQLSQSKQMFLIEKTKAELNIKKGSNK